MQKDFFTFQPALQADHHRQPQAAAAECGRSRSPALQSHSLHSHAGRMSTAAAGEKLKAEWPGILRWMIEGCLDWQANGLVRPGERRPGDRKLFRGSGPAGAMARLRRAMPSRGTATSTRRRQTVRVMDRVCQTGGREAGQPQGIQHGTEQAGVRAFQGGPRQYPELQRAPAETVVAKMAATTSHQGHATTCDRMRPHFPIPRTRARARDGAI